MLKEHKYWIRTLETEVKYQVNRSIQTMPTFMDLNKWHWKTWEDTKSTLGRGILRVIPAFEFNAIYFNRERSHR